MRLRLLIADDEELARASIRKMVESLAEDFGEIVEAERGDEVIEAARSFRPDLVLLDVRMPGLNGLDAAAQIRAIDPDARIIVVTAYDRFSLAQRAVNLGLDGYLLKPLIEEEFRKAMAAAARRIERARGAGRGLAASDAGPLSPPDLAAGEDRLIRSLLRGRLASPAEAAAELLAAWAGAGLEPTQRTRAFAFALAREAERSSLAGGLVEDVTRGLAPDALLGEAEPVLALEELLLAWTPPSATESGESGPRILDWLAETPSADLSLDSLAARLHLSPSSASRLFREATGRSFASYVADLRMERAIAILSGTPSDLAPTLEVLARSVGYGDAAYFGKLFKERTGMSPREFSRSRREAGPSSS